MARTKKEIELGLVSVGQYQHKARLFLGQNGYNNAKKKEILDNIRHDIPNVRRMNSKYILGVTRMYINGELNDAEQILKLNNALHYLTDEAHVKEYDENLNGETATTITQRFQIVAEEDLRKAKKESAARKNELTVNEDYEIVEIDTAEKASKYSKYTSWCVTQSSSAFDSYTGSGAGKFYFCLKKGFEKVPATRTDHGPLDEYGLSMIAVSVSMDGESNTITCRWNHDCGGNDSVMTVKELEKLLGRPFYETFKPYTKEELIAKGKYVSPVIGKYYLDIKTETEGIIMRVDENEKPCFIMGLETPTESMNWYEAMEYNKTLTNGWHLPSKEELEDVWFITGYDNPITKRINNGIKHYNEHIYNKLELVGNEVHWMNEDGELVVFDANQPIVI